MSAEPVQFGPEQTESLRAIWGSSNVFYASLGQPARDVIEVAYGLQPASPVRKEICREDVRLVFSIMTNSLGCEKSQAVHAFLTNGIRQLYDAVLKLRRERGHYTLSYYKFVQQLTDAWIDCFRIIGMNRIEEQLDQQFGVRPYDTGK